MAEKAAHIINERQKKGALSTIKKKPKLPKNVLVNNLTEMWPCLNEKQNDEFVELLENFSSQAESAKQVSIGLESTLRLLKRNEVKLLVIADELSPRWFAKHLIAMALHRNPKTKVIVVKNLKEVSKSSLKVPAIIFGVKTSDFDEFYDVKVGSHTELLQNYHKVKSTTNVCLKRKKQKPASVDNPVVLLKKPSDSTRAFVPMDVDESPESQGVSAQDSSGFIAFSKLNVASNIASSPLPSYRPIKIKKITGNSNRKAEKS